MKNEDNTNNKNKKKKGRKKRRPGRIIRNIILGIVIAFAALFLLGNLFFHYKYGETIFSCAKFGKEAVAESTADTFRPNQASTVYSSDGKEIAKLYEDTESTYLDFDNIPKNVINAFVAVEDRTFWKNSGIDVKGIVRVSLNFLKTKGDVAQGASTITQQLSRDIFLTNEKSLVRKVKEIFIAMNLNKKYSKEEIMEYYCNNVCFANGIFGIEDASQTYFNKPASQLTLSEAAYLCAIPNRPEYYNPFKDSSNAITRRDKILEDMYECGYITQQEMNDAVSEEITIAKQEDNDEFYNYETSFAIKCATEYLMGYLYDFNFQYQFDTDSEYAEYHQKYNEVYQQAKHRLYTGGYEIQTSLDLEAQQGLQEVVNNQLSFDQRLKKGSETYNLQSGMTVIDNNTGKVVASVGGREQEGITQALSYNHSFQGSNQPGSSIKPLVVYTPALMKGYTPTSAIPDINVDVAKKSTQKVSSMTGTKYSLREAVVRSKNGCAYWLLNDITPKYGLSFLEEMGFSNLHPNDNNLSAALGGFSYGTSPWEMANAYYTLYNSGTYTKADCLTSIKDNTGKEIYEAPASKEVYSSTASDEIIDIMRGVFKSPGTASSLNWSSSTQTEAAGKTGTTNDNRDGWFCGFTPYYTIAVWVGNDDNSPYPGLSGSTYPARIWKEAMLYMIKDKPAASFDLSVSGSSNTVVPDEEETETDNTDSTDNTNTDTQDNTQQNPADTPQTTPDTPDDNQDDNPDDIQGDIKPDPDDGGSTDTPSTDPDTPPDGGDGGSDSEGDQGQDSQQKPDGSGQGSSSSGSQTNQNSKN
ncbi:Penicillin-binding protein 4 precursor [uncultured Roseburia sp.]|uniref:Penicillin-binding protein 1A n=1 Tax=Brotonthovivens ammoniilytica TaxID=2981725 RepID=A0ABT2TKT8_9FIRM|nr:transglycosylase domain-containing protein [Brotonthovivens ammoniilytica]MCU6762830.1 penicillin-binding protein [Brotonthovivens ammoniilytica]SCI90447.1 Penicillin-binding protein 4 precursor [uncultured Roseburia sp.]